MLVLSTMGRLLTISPGSLQYSKFPNFVHFVSIFMGLVLGEVININTSD